MDGRSRAQVNAPNRASSSPIAARGLLQRKCTQCKKKDKSLTDSRDFGLAEGIQRMPAISQPGDQYEQEADRIAEYIVSGRSGLAHPSLRAPTTIQRLEREKDPKKNEDKQKEAMKKTGEALLKTDAGKQIIDTAESIAKSATSTPVGKVITGAVAASAVAAIYAGNLELPMQLPEIPLDFLYQGMKVKLTYEGPARSPSAASISITFGENLPSPGSPSGVEEASRERSRPGESPRSPSFSVSPSGEVVDAVGRRLRTPEMMAEEMARYTEELRKNNPPPNYEMPRVWPDFRPRSSQSYRQAGVSEGPYRIRPEALRPPRIDGQPERKEEDLTIQRKDADGGQITSVPPIVHEVLQSSGQPLDLETRAYFEERFGHDFSDVRVHTDNQAADSARALDSFAFTVGSDIVFKKGAYDPKNPEGRRLIAHELAHSLQQTGMVQEASGLKISHSGDSKEYDADQMATAAISGHFTEIASNITPCIQRKPDQGEFKKDQVVSLKLPVLRMGTDLGGSTVAAVLKKGDLLKLGELHPNGQGRVFYATVIQTSDEKYNGKTGVVRTDWIQATDTPQSSPLPPPTTYHDIELVGRTMADYVDNRYYAVGVAMDFSGYVLYFNGIDLPVFIPSSYVNLSLSQANAREDKIYSSRDEALGALGQSAGTSYAYYTAVSGLIAPTVFSPATTPRIAEGIREWYKHLDEAANELLVTVLLIAGTKIAIKIFSRLGGLIKRLTSSRARAASQKAFEAEAKAAAEEFGGTAEAPARELGGASSLPTVNPNSIPAIWRATPPPLSGGNDVYVYRGFARNATSHAATVVREGETGGILSRRLDAAHDAVFNQVGRDPVLSGPEAGGVVRVKIPANKWDELVRTNNISERGNYPGFSRQLNSSEIRVNSPEAGRLINSSPKDALPPDRYYDFRPGVNRPSGPQEPIQSPGGSGSTPQDIGERETLPPPR